jgi:crossover junction endodeoxyribonuclease RuvC
VKVFGIDPGSDRTGYGCVETDGSRHRLVACGAIATPRRAPFPDKLLAIHDRLAALLTKWRPDAVAVENIFYASNVRTALKLGHARGVAILAAVEAGVPVAEYTPAEIKRAIVGYGRAEAPDSGDGSTTARPDPGPDAVRCRRRPGRRHLSRTRTGDRDDSCCGRRGPAGGPGTAETLAGLPAE